MHWSPLKTVAVLAGITYHAAWKLQQQGIIRPLKIKGETFDAYSTLETLTAALAAELKRRGCSSVQIGMVANWLHQKSMSDLQAEWLKDQRFLMVIGDQPPFYRQWSYDEIFDNPDIDFVAASRISIPIAIVDLEACWAKVLSRQAALKPQEPRKAVPCV